MTQEKYHQFGDLPPKPIVNPVQGEMFPQTAFSGEPFETVPSVSLELCGPPPSDIPKSTPDTHVRDPYESSTRRAEHRVRVRDGEDLRREQTGLPDGPPEAGYIPPGAPGSPEWKEMKARLNDDPDGERARRKTRRDDLDMMF